MVHPDLEAAVRLLEVEASGNQTQVHSLVEPVVGAALAALVAQLLQTNHHLALPARRTILSEDRGDENTSQ